MSKTSFAKGVTRRRTPGSHGVTQSLQRNTFFKTWPFPKHFQRTDQIYGGGGGQGMTRTRFAQIGRPKPTSTTREKAQPTITTHHSSSTQQPGIENRQLPPPPPINGRLKPKWLHKIVWGQEVIRSPLTQELVFFNNNVNKIRLWARESMFCIKRISCFSFGTPTATR